MIVRAAKIEHHHYLSLFNNATVTTFVHSNHPYTTDLKLNIKRLTDETHQQGAQMGKCRTTLPVYSKLNAAKR